MTDFMVLPPPVYGHAAWSPALHHLRGAWQLRVHTQCLRDAGTAGRAVPQWLGCVGTAAGGSHPSGVSCAGAGPPVYTFLHLLLLYNFLESIGPET